MIPYALSAVVLCTSKIPRSDVGNRAIRPRTRDKAQNAAENLKLKLSWSLHLGSGCTQSRYMISRKLSHHGRDADFLEVLWASGTASVQMTSSISWSAGDMYMYGFSRGILGVEFCICSDEMKH